MPITGLPTFTSGILTAAQLNAVVTALEEKFAGRITTGDISWPLTAGGDINMGQYSLLNVGKFWNAYDASARAAGTTLQSVLDALNGDGGGVVIFPGNSNEDMPQAGISMYSNIWLVGDGYTSTLTMHASANAAMITVGSGIDNAGLFGLRLIGNTSVNQIFVDNNNGDNCRVQECWFDTHGTSEFIKCRGGAIGMHIDDCDFVGNGSTNAQNMLVGTSCRGLRVTGSRFVDWTDRVLYLQPAAASAVDGTMFADNKMRRVDSTATARTSNFALDWDNTNSVACVGLTIIDNELLGAPGTVGGLVVKGNGLTGVIFTDNEFSVSIEAPAVKIYSNTQQIVLNDNRIESLAGDGFVLGLDAGTEGSGRTASIVREITVSGNNVYSTSATVGDGTCLLMAPSETSNGLRCAVSGNKFVSRHANVIAIWNVGTTRPLYTTISGNMCFPWDATYKGFASYQTVDGATAGDIGTANIAWWFTMVGNTVPGTASGTDYTHSAAHKCIVQDNNE